MRRRRGARIRSGSCSVLGGGGFALLTSLSLLRPLYAAVGVEPEDTDLEVVPLITEPIPPVDNEAIERPYAPLRPQTTCPENVEKLTALLIRDLPGYANRVLQRMVAALPNNETDGREPYRPSYVLVAGQPEFEPIELDEYALTTDPEAGGALDQVFFTTLSRQYAGLQDRQVQEYHWLFLTRASDGWRLAFMFSAIDDAPGGSSVILPPRENSEGSVGQAVQIWLKDCRAGAIYPLEP